MKRMTLDETWKNCLSMWRWIAKQKRAGNLANTEDLKKEWCIKHGVKGIKHDCFFCAFARARYVNTHLCRTGCPARKIDSDFRCDSYKYHFEQKPIAFYNKLVSLNRKRLKGKK